MFRIKLLKDFRKWKNHALFEDKTQSATQSGNSVFILISNLFTCQNILLLAETILWCKVHKQYKTFYSGSFKEDIYCVFNVYQYICHALSIDHATLTIGNFDIIPNSSKNVIHKNYFVQLFHIRNNH